MIRFEFFNNSDERVAQWLRSRHQRIVEELGPGMMRAMVALASYIGTEKLSGQVLKVRFGTLRRAVIGSARQYSTGSTVEGRVGTDSTTWYGQLHEDGGSFVGHRKLKKPPHLMRRKMGERVLTGSPYGIRFPARPFMRPSLQEQRGMIIEELAKAMQKAIAAD
jgi:hypothetical protein